MSVLEVRERESADFDRAMSAFDWSGVEHTAEFHEGTAAEGILELASSSDLVVIATHGRTGLAAAVLGSVARSVLQHAETLRMLTLRTLADARATSDKLWNEFKESLLWELSSKALKVLQGGTDFIRAEERQRELLPG